MAKKKTVQVEMRQGSSTTSKKKPNGETENSVENVGEPRMFTDPPCNVGLTLGGTFPDKGYGNTKVSASLHVPCKHEEIDETFEFIKEWLDDKMADLTSDL